MAKFTYSSDTSRFAYLWEEGYEFKMMAYLSEGWTLYKKSPLILSLFFLLLGIIMALTSSVVSFIPVPYVGALGGKFVTILLSQLLIAGYYIAGNKLRQNKILDFGDLFEGFSHFGELVIVALITFVLTLIAGIPVQLALGSGIEGVLGTQDPELLIAQFKALLENPTNLLFVVLAALPSLYISLVYIFGTPAVVISRIKAWPAMETSRKILTAKIFHVFALLLLIAVAIAVVGAVFAALFFTVSGSMGAMVVLGFLALAAMFVVFPWMMMVYSAAYEDIMGVDITSELDEKIDEFGADVETEEDIF